MTLEIHVVTHTHWDREWYHPAERFRQRLVELIDELIDAPPPPGESFLLDGQAIILDDYLDVRPERAGQLESLLREGRLEAGPWYVLADELIPSGEALVRNLLMGRRTLERFDAKPPPVLYCPDSFGHPAALPTIAHGFGFPLIILWRGYGGARWPSGDTVRWAAPSGEKILVFHLPHDGYEFGSNLPADPVEAMARWQTIRAELAGRSATGVLLVQNGADHHARQLNHDAAIRALVDAAMPDDAHPSSLRAFAERIVERSARQRLPVVRGELRDSYGYAWTLQGTFGSRAAEKRLNATAERALLRDAEPWAALAAAFGRSRTPLTRAAWRTLLAAHPHDTLCGCSIDEVASAMELRLRSVINQASGIREDSVADLLGHDPVLARTTKDRWRSHAIVRNAVARRRSGVAIVELVDFIADVGVGPGSRPVDVEETDRPIPSVPSLGDLQPLARSVQYDRIESPRHYPDNDLVAVTRAAAWVSDVPGYGLVAHPFGEERLGVVAPADGVTVGAHFLRNAQLSVDVDSSGNVTVAQRSNGRRIASLIAVEDEIDRGDLYTPSPRGAGARAVFRGAHVVHRGPLRGELSLSWQLISSAVGKRVRVAAELSIDLILDAAASFLRVNVRGRNRAGDHRLRLRVASDIHEPSVCADAAFGLVSRRRIMISEDEAAVEAAPPTAPLHRYVSLYDESRGFTLFSDGLAEYETTDDGSILITLVRAVGELSRNDLPERPGHAGWPTHTPSAQSLGHFEGHFAVMLHAARLPSTIDAVERAADDVLIPLVATTLRSAMSTPPAVHGIELEGPGMAFSTVKESEEQGWITLRCVNLLDQDVRGCWRLGFPTREAWLARLDETRLQPIAVRGNVVAFVAPPRGVVTILVR